MKIQKITESRKRKNRKYSENVEQHRYRIDWKRRRASEFPQRNLILQNRVKKSRFYLSRTTQIENSKTVLKLLRTYDDKNNKETKWTCERNKSHTDWSRQIITHEWKILWIYYQIGSQRTVMNHESTFEYKGSFHDDEVCQMRRRTICFSKKIARTRKPRRSKKLIEIDKFLKFVNTVGNSRRNSQLKKKSSSRQAPV